MFQGVASYFNVFSCFCCCFSCPSCYTPLSESQILEQTTQDLDFNYDSRENLNYTESGETFEEFEAQLVQLLERMKQLSTVNQIFHEFFIGDDIDENWPRSLSPTEKIEQYKQLELF